MENTRDTRDFSRRQLQLAGKMMACIGTELDCTEVLGDHVAVELNPESGIVFLIDASFKVAMLDGNLLKDWFRCPCCGAEGFERSMQGKECCKKHVAAEMQIGDGKESAGPCCVPGKAS